MTAYKIVKGSTFLLEEEIEKLIKKGYQPYGELIVSVYTSMQVMVKYKQDTIILKGNEG